MGFKCDLVASSPTVSIFNKLACPTDGMWHMDTKWSGGGGSLLWSCGMTYVLQELVDPGQEAGLESVVGVVVVVPSETLCHPSECFLRELESRLPQNMQEHFHSLRSRMLLLINKLSFFYSKLVQSISRFRDLETPHTWCCNPDVYCVDW